MQVAQECVIVDPEFFLYMMLPNGTQAFGTALFFIMLGYGFLNSFGRVPADLVVSFYRFFDWVSSLVSGRQGGECLVFRVFILQRLSIIHICQTVLPGFKKIINMPFFFIFVRGVVKSEREIIHKDTNYSE